MTKNQLKGAIILACIIAVIPCGKAQKSEPYKVKVSAAFESPKGHEILDPIGYGKDGIIQFYRKDLKSFAFQKFSTELKLLKENIVEPGDKLNENTEYQGIEKFKNKTYLFVRESFKGKTEGISALEFSPKTLDFLGKSVSLFKSNGKLRGAVRNMITYEISHTSHALITSEDKTKFMCSYILESTGNGDNSEKRTVGIHVFDEDLSNIMGGEFEMPYPLSVMDNLGYTVSDDGKVYLLARIFSNAEKNKKPNHHYEVFVYQNGDSDPTIIPIKLEGNFPLSAHIYEDPGHHILIAGFYSKVPNSTVNGAYLLKLDAANKDATNFHEGYYKIPENIQSAYEKPGRATNNNDNENEGLGNLYIRKIYTTPDGSIRIIAEQYYLTSHTASNSTNESFDSYAEDIYLLSINATGQAEWLKKIPKSQHSNDGKGKQLSFNTYVTENELHIFYIDNIKNLNLKESEVTSTHESKKGGFLTGANINPEGVIIKYKLDEIEKFDNNFFVRLFIDGGDNNLIRTERSSKMNVMYSIGIK